MERLRLVLGGVVREAAAGYIALEQGGAVKARDMVPDALAVGQAYLDSLHRDFSETRVRAAMDHIRGEPMLQLGLAGGSDELVSETAGLGVAMEEAVGALL